ncbi:MAG TPA: hypothetical protein VFP80_06270, partial [Thermoanaerobaculia bacterium]|nr:hypothetical protein [Thermoanaerobaculia bacterium]
PGERAVLDFRQQPTHGVVILSSNPPGATMSIEPNLLPIDGGSKLRTLPGTYRVVAVLGRISRTETVTVEAGRTTTAVIELGSEMNAPPDITFSYQTPGGEEPDHMIEHEVRWLEDTRWREQSDDGGEILYSFVQMETVEGVYGAIIRSDQGDRELFVPYDGQTKVLYHRKPGFNWASLSLSARSSRRDQFAYVTSKVVLEAFPGVREQVEWSRDAKGRWTEIRATLKFTGNPPSITGKWQEIGVITVEGSRGVLVQRTMSFVDPTGAEKHEEVFIPDIGAGGQKPDTVRRRFSGGDWSDFVNLDTGEEFE